MSLRCDHRSTSCQQSSLAVADQKSTRERERKRERERERERVEKMESESQQSAAQNALQFCRAS